MRRIFISIFFLLITHVLSAQTVTIDRLRHLLNTVSNGTEKLTILLKLCDYHSSLHKDSLYKYASLAQQLAVNQKEESLKGKAAVAMAYAYLQIGNKDSASAIIEAALPLNTLKNAATRDIFFELSAQKADVFGDASSYKEALQQLYNIVSDAELYKDSVVLVKNMNTIAVINYNMDDVPDAFNWYYKGLSYTNTQQKFDAPKAAIYINLADAYRWIEKTDSAIYFINLAIPLCEKSENLFYLSNALRVKSSIYKKEKKFSEAEATLLQALSISEKINGKRLFSNEGLALAQLYRSSGNISKAIEELKAALAADSAMNAGNVSSSDRLRIEYYSVLAACYQSTGDEKNYTVTLEKLLEEKDKFYEANSAQAIAELKTKYDLQKKESTIIKQQLDLTQKNYLFYGSLALLLFAGVLGFLLFKNYRRKQQLITEQLLFEEKVASLHAVKTAEENERKRIAADLHDNLGAYAASIVSNLDQISIQFPDTKTMVSFQELKNNSRGIVSQLGDTIWALKKDELSLTAISDRVKVFMQRLQPSYPDISMETEEDIEDDKVLPALQAFHLFRIIQEAVNNALKHGRSKTITVHISSNTNWQIRIKDDGIGFDIQQNKSNGYGLHNMKTRAEEFDWKIEWQHQQKGITVLIKPTTN